MLHLQNDVKLSQSAQFLFVRPSLQFQGILSFPHTSSWVIACQYPIIGRSKFLYYNSFEQHFVPGIWLHLADQVLL
jgi:hypothetical protein